MKRKIAFLLSALLLLFPVSCGGDPKGTENSGAETSAGGNSDTAGVSSFDDSTPEPVESSSSSRGSAGSSGGGPVRSTGGSVGASSSKPSGGTASEGSTGGINWGSNKLLLRNPPHGGYASTTASFEWSGINAKSFTFYLEERTAFGYKQIEKKTGLKTNKYKPAAGLQSAKTYRWRVEAVTDSGVTRHAGSTDKGAVFMTVPNPKNHPANAGKDFSFDGKISEKVLKNYLSRSVTHSLISSPSPNYDSDVRMIFNMGAKYIARAIIPWVPEKSYDFDDTYKAKISAMHAVDPDLIFEACIFETVWPSCEETPIPAWVFEAFGLKPEKRNFSYTEMLFPGGKYVNHWGEGGSIPDITRTETQMYFYYRACMYIDAGFECIHWGQVNLIGERDKEDGWRQYHKVLTMVRNYAKKNARRHFVLNNAHLHGAKGPDGILLFDFHGYPIRGLAPKNESVRPPSEKNPQTVELKRGIIDSIYGRSMGGKTVSGWSCNSLPFFVELDNGDGYERGHLNDPKRDYWLWGMDEISWFANQPKSYRAQWLKYAYNWVRANDSQGFLMMPGSRPAYMQNIDKMTWYYAHDTDLADFGWGDEEAIKSVWVDDNKK